MDRGASPSRWRNFGLTDYFSVVFDSCAAGGGGNMKKGASDGDTVNMTGDSGQTISKASTLGTDALQCKFVTTGKN